MQPFKVRTNSIDHSIAAQKQAFSNGITWRSGSIQVVPEYSQYGLYIDNQMGMLRATTEEYFNLRPEPEISYEDFLKIGEEQQINNNMPDQNEIELKLIKEPKKTKNLTVGNVYKGVYIDDEETQVDHLKDAKYFFCVNDSGKEARYSIDLFGSAEDVVQKPVIKAPVAPPRPRDLSLDEILETINYNENFTTAVFVENGPRITILLFGYDAFSEDSSDISCGVSQLWELNNTFESIEARLIIPGADLQAKRQVFKEMLRARINNSDESGKFVVMSTQTSEKDVCIAVDELTEELGGCSVIGVNPNSRNEIKVWTIAKP